jgi:hypothetical protein
MKLKHLNYMKNMKISYSKFFNENNLVYILKY